ncbi:MAG: hypothetical protein NTV01_08995 [Bacteroidia bacterium]|nr:hypothetical protein [Bacteroidia bacterium]
MKRTNLLLLFTCCCMMGIGQNISLTFTGTGAVSQVGSITATNLRINQSVTFPGDETLILSVNIGVPEIPEPAGNGIFFPNPFSGRTTFTASIQDPQTINMRVQNLLGQVVYKSKL